MRKRLLSILLAAVMLLSALPLGLVDTAEAAAVSSGQCGDNIRWTLDDRGTLTISGTGAMYDYGFIWNGEEWEDIKAPWFGLCEQLRRAVVGEGVTHIGAGAFADLYNLTSVSLPAGLEGLGEGVFRNCEKLTSVAIPDGVRYAIGDIFSGCRSLKTVSLPDSLQDLGGGTFFECASLTNVTLPRGLNLVTWCMFYGCTALTTVTLPGGIQEISKSAFSGCTALSTVHFGGSQAGWQAVTVRPDNDALKRARVDYAAAAMLPAPKLTGSVNRYGELTLNWTAVKGADSYQIFRTEKYDDGYEVSWEYSLYDWVDGSQTSLSTSWQEAGETYVYKVRAMDKDETAGICSNEYTFTYNPTGPGATSSGSGKCGANAYWELSADGVLTISGTGAMYDYDVAVGTKPTPWGTDGLNNRVRTVVVEKGITELGCDAFTRCYQLSELTLPASLKTVGRYATSGTSITDVYFAGTAAQWDAIRMEFGNDWLFALPAIHYKNSAAVPAAAKLTAAGSASGNVSLSWDAVPGAVSYKVFRIEDYDTEEFTLLCVTQDTRYVDTKAASGGQFDYMIKAVNANGESGGSNVCSVEVTKPAAPDNVTLTGAKAVSDGIQVTWQAANGAEQYRVYRKDAANPKWKGIATVTGTSWTDKTAQAGVKYTYTVRGISANGTLSPGFDTTGVSATIPGTPTPTTPANVTLGSAKVSGSTIVVTWQAANGAAQYRVYRKDAANPKWKGIANVTGTSWTDKTAQAGVKYTYTVRGISANGTLSPGFDTTGVSATVPGTPTPTTPANVTLGSAKVSGSTIVVTWQAANGAAQYRVYRKDAANPKWKGIANVTGTSWTDKTAVAGVKYTYTVRGISANGTLSPGFDTTGVSATVPGTPTPAPTTPAEVTLIGAVAGSDGITVKWKAAAGAKEYRVYRKGPGETKWKGLVNVTGISWTDRGVKAGAKYTYTVRGIGADGKTLSPTYNNLGVSTTATVTPVPITPANVTLIGATAGSSGIQVTWKTAAGAEKYRVYRIGPGDAKWVGLVNVTGTGWTDTNVTKGVKYTYTVRGISVDGKLSPGFDKTGVSAVAK